MKKYIATEKDTGMRLGKVVQRIFFPEHSQKFVKRLIDSNRCFVNQKAERFASKKIAKGDQISISKELSSENESPIVLFEDDHICLIRKPAGIESDPATLGFFDYFLVHRLDKPTSGVMILAKDIPSKQALEEAFAKREVSKKYLAITDGAFPEMEGSIENQYGKKQEYDGGAIWGEVEKGVSARTDFRIISSSDSYSLLELSPITGRTHQIRSHLAEKGFPVLGDYQYGRNLKRTLHIPYLMLHAYEISFAHPITKEKLSFQSELPLYFSEQIERYSLEF